MTRKGRDQTCRKTPMETEVKDVKERPQKERNRELEGRNGSQNEREKAFGERERPRK